MAIERTFSIVKPDAVAKNFIGQIYNRFETAGLKIVAERVLPPKNDHIFGAHFFILFSWFFSFPFRFYFQFRRSDALVHLKAQHTSSM